MRYTALFAGIAILCSASFAQAFVQTEGCNATGDVCSLLAWPSNCATFSIDASAEQKSGLPFEDLLREIDISFASWSLLSCSFLSIQNLGVVEGETVGFDNDGLEINLVTFVDEGWVELGPGHDPGAIALTSVFFDPKTGVIVNADIEFNAEFFEPVIAGQFDGIDPQRLDADVRNTLTHEAGHFLGLDHSGSAEATMFFVADEGETLKQTLDLDDINGTCAIYPLEEDPGVCEPAGFLPRNGIFQCSVSDPPSKESSSLPIWLLLFSLGAYFLVNFRRRNIASLL